MPLSRIMYAALAGAALLVAGPLSAKKDEETPYTYGPPPDWAKFNELGEAAIRDKMIDPDSAKFQWPHGYVRSFFKPFLDKRVNGYVTCGFVNGRNRMGGYAGRAYFVVVEDFGGVVYAAMGDSDGRDFISQACEKSNLPPPPAASVGPQSPLGVDFLMMPSGAFVSAVAPGGPGERAGIKAGMVVAKVNGIAVKGMSADLLRQLLAGIEGTASLELNSGDVVKVEKP